MVIAAFDLGGSHISCGYFEFSSLRLIEKEEGAVQSVQTEELSSLRTLIDLAESTKKRHGASLMGLCLSVPGPFDCERGVSHMQHKLPELHGLSLKRILSDATRLPERDIVFMNDADAFLLGALFALKISSGRSVGITLGTGIGSAFAVGSQILSGGEGVPEGGEIWNLPYGRGTVEDVISTRRLEAEYRRRTGSSASVKAIAVAAGGGEPAALEVFRDFGRELGEVLERIVGGFDPERVLLGGGISSARDLFLPSVLAVAWCAGRVSIVTGRDIAPLIGAAAGWRLRVDAEFSRSGQFEEGMLASSKGSES